MTFINAITGFFIGENSKKRILAVGLFIILVGAYAFGYVNAEFVLLAIPLLSAFAGAAYNARFKKLFLSFVDMMEKQKETENRINKLEATNRGTKKGPA